VDADDSRTLADLLTTRPGNQWCVTLTNPAGHPVAHACARHGPPGPPGPRPPASPGQQPTHAGLSPQRPGHGGPDPGGRRPGERDRPSGPTGSSPPGDRTSPRPRPGNPVPPSTGPGPATTPVPDWLRGLTFTTLQTSDCAHPRESRGYQPSRGLRHLIQIRNPVCTGPGCRRPATRCDLDHVTPYHRGGETCEGNLHPASKS
jgi:hypothetical protein